MRVFVAVDLPARIQAALAEQQAAFRAALETESRHADEVRWTRPEGIHLTLKFLGHIPEDRVEKVVKALESVGVAEEVEIEVKGFGFFPDARRPRVFWVGIQPSPALKDLATRVESAMEKLGFVPERRAFSPHLTLARFKSPRAQPHLQSLLSQRADLSLGSFRVSEFYLFESKLSPRGAEYRKVARFPR